MRIIHPIRFGALLALCATLTAACLGFDDTLDLPPSPPSGAVRVTVTTTGQELDPDGYLVHVDNAVNGLRVNANGALLLSHLRPGPHFLTLTEIAPNCEVAVSNVRQVTIIVDDTVDVAFGSTCSNLGTVKVTAVTTGVDPDPEGYVVGIIARRPSLKSEYVRVANNETVTPRIAAGDYELTFAGIAANCEVSESQRRDIKVVSADTIAFAFHLACAPVSLLAFVDQGRVYLINSNGTGASPLTDYAAEREDPAWSPDGRKLAVTATRNSNPDIEVMNADGSGIVRLTTDAAADDQADWSPDGARLVFVSTRDGNPELYVMNADGTDPVRLTNNAAADVDPAWSPDGRTIAFTSYREGNREIYVINVDGSGIRRITTFSGSDTQPAWSPDGTRLAFTRKCLGTTCAETIVVANADGSGLKEYETGAEPAWSPDGRRIVYRSVFCPFYYYYNDGCEYYGLRILALDSGFSERLVDGIAASEPAWRK